MSRSKAAGPGVPDGAQIAQHGAPTANVPPCMACHGEGGEGVASSGPRLAGLSEAYILSQLAAFRSGARKSPLMQSIARGLTEKQAASLADYFSSTVADSEPVAATGDLASAGKTLAERGRWSAGLPACNSCHAPRGIGVAPSFPYLAGQRAEYIEQQLKNWRTGERTGDPLGLMKTVADKLGDADVNAAAAYYASLPAPRRQGGGD